MKKQNTREEIYDYIFEQAKKEYQNFRKYVATLPPELIMDKGYELFIKADFLLDLENSEADAYSDEAIEKLFQESSELTLLDCLFQEWINNDYSYMDLIHQTIEDFSK